jgi:hypothetical protein
MICGRLYTSHILNDYETQFENLLKKNYIDIEEEKSIIFNYFNNNFNIFFMKYIKKDNENTNYFLYDNENEINIDLFEKCFYRYYDKYKKYKNYIIFYYYYFNRIGLNIPWNLLSLDYKHLTYDPNLKIHIENYLINKPKFHNILFDFNDLYIDNKVEYIIKEKTKLFTEDNIFHYVNFQLIKKLFNTSINDIYLDLCDTIVTLNYYLNVMMPNIILEPNNKFKYYYNNIEYSGTIDNVYKSQEFIIDRNAFLNRISLKSINNNDNMNFKLYFKTKDIDEQLSNINISEYKMNQLNVKDIINYILCNDINIVYKK